jgi:cytochrome c peroxidase
MSRRGINLTVKPPSDTATGHIIAAFFWLCLTLVSTTCWPSPLGLPPVALGDSAQERGLADLGRRLFVDKRLSADGTISCASCHIAERHFTDGRATASGLHGKVLVRHTPSLLNVRYATSLFWDGRAPDLVTQVRSPLLAPAEHGLGSEEAVGAIVRADPDYTRAFAHVFGVARKSISIREVGEALAAYERTLLAGNSAFDRYLYGGESSAMSAAALRGLALFRGRAQCANCHTIGAASALLTDGNVHASPISMSASTLSQLGALTDQVGALRRDGKIDEMNALIESDRDIAALGHFVATLDPKDIGQFKTPSLRNVALTGPYMHDGSVASLAEAVELELYSRSAQNYPLVLTEDERADLVAFLQALSSS